MSSADPAWERVHDVAWVEDDARVVVLRLARLDAEPLLLDGPAAEVWRRLEAPVGLDALVADLAHDFDGDPAVVRADVAAFLRDAEAAGVVRPLDPADPADPVA
ncbi:hypothetical protein GCM10023340_19980 [Nocardioides marinquilinus]|uniref:PqqD family protein n=1 Tax=Nocardioides marinquilinus TaxID=1210400 RepID=A0ABP9PJ48_9ACTN